MDFSVGLPVVVVTEVRMLLEKNADLADLAFGEIGRNSAPQEKPSGTLTARNSFLLPHKYALSNPTTLSFSLPLGEEASFRTPGGEIFVPSDGLRPT